MPKQTTRPDIGPQNAARRLLARYPRLVLVALCLMLWLPGFFTLPPGDRDESRFAQASKQMLESGDYVRIMNGDVPRLKKPIGIYWLQVPFAAAARAAGVATQNPIWPYRLPSLLGGIAAVLATFALGRALGFAQNEATLAAALLAACALLTVETHIAKTDAALLASITIATALLARAAVGTLTARGALGFWAMLAAGVLLKGPVAPMVLGLTALSHALWARDRRFWAALRPRTGIFVFAALVLPWFLAITVATHGAFFSQSVGNDLGRKLAGGDDGHGGFFGQHLLLLPLLAFPATLPVIAGLYRAARARHDRASQFLLCVILPNWLVFEAVPTKLPHYTLPLYPALMLLAAHGLSRPQTSPAWVNRLGFGAFALSAAALALAAAMLPALLGAPIWLGLAAVPLAALAVWLGSAHPLRAILPSGALLALILAVVLPGTTAVWIAPRLTAALNRVLPGRDVRGRGVAVVDFAEPSLMFLAGSHITFAGTADSAAAMLARRDVVLVAVSGRSSAAFIADCARRQVAVVPGETIAGYNYARGQKIALTIFTRAAPTSGANP